MYKLTSTDWCSLRSNASSTIEGILKYNFGNYPNDNTPFPQNGPITRENMVDENLKISIGTKILDSNIFEDESGNNNRAFVFDDYRPNFDSVTLEPKKVKRFNKIKKSRYKRGF